MAAIATTGFSLFFISSQHTPAATIIRAKLLSKELRNKSLRSSLKPFTNARTGASRASFCCGSLMPLICFSKNPSLDSLEKSPLK